jgi:hypothetical protein
VSGNRYGCQTYRGDAVRQRGGGRRNPASRAREVDAARIETRGHLASAVREEAVYIEVDEDDFWRPIPSCRRRYPSISTTMPIRKTRAWAPAVKGRKKRTAPIRFLACAPDAVSYQLDCLAATTRATLMRMSAAYCAGCEPLRFLLHHAIVVVKMRSSLEPIVTADERRSTPKPTRRDLGTSRSHLRSSACIGGSSCSLIFEMRGIERAHLV